MYFAMDEIGLQRMAAIQALPTEAARWAYLVETARAYEFEGIHLTPNLYEQMGIPLERAPRVLRDWRLTWHMGGGDLLRDDDLAGWDARLRQAFAACGSLGVEDVSIHPPYASADLPEAERQACRARFAGLVEKWLPLAHLQGATLSLETHISPNYFLFRGYAEYTAFVDAYPSLGILIDVSHNVYDGYTAEDILRTFLPRPVTALHVSDALPGAEFRAGTHLAVGQGVVDFAPLVAAWPGDDIVAALEIKADDEALRDSLIALKRLRASAASCP